MHEPFEWFPHSVNKIQAIWPLQGKWPGQRQDAIWEREIVEVHNGQYQFKVLFMLYTNSEGVYSVYISSLHMEMFLIHWKCTMVKTVWKTLKEYIEDEVKNIIFRLHTIFPQQPMIELIDMFKREQKATEKCRLY